jgi:hypothetical protein
LHGAGPGVKNLYSENQIPLHARGIIFVSPEDRSGKRHLDRFIVVIIGESEGASIERQ